MTSEQNKLLPKLAPKAVIGVKRKPNRKDLYDRRDPHDQKPLRGLPDPDPDVVLRRAALNLEQAALRMQHAIPEANPESSLRESLTVLADPEAPWSDSDWETITDPDSGSELDDEGEKGVEDAFIAKVRGVEVGEVTAVRVPPVRTNIPAFIKKVRAVKGRGSNVAAAAVPVLPNTRMQPGDTRELTAAEAALALTNRQAGTSVTMEDLRATKKTKIVHDDGDKYRWTVGSVSTRALTVAEAALVLTNVQAGTNVTMQDLRTAREMVDLWDNQDTFEWTVGNVE
ncbi:hypothetical protein HO173_000535 [Letharia columbiana]|uniref:Uncharacterized protein n=1 Tax=Letharia columbiana TaxID=112416 RepID=A0A8H6G741_9LECA|nr:uncharacterized protein HO173_000535 [Letharia columbiana]KAF6241823.1 hypothetical protein HO173_000535 [Letharia columbiana]